MSNSFGHSCLLVILNLAFVVQVLPASQNAQSLPVPMWKEAHRAEAKGTRTRPAADSRRARC